VVAPSRVAVALVRGAPHELDRLLPPVSCQAQMSSPDCQLPRVNCRANASNRRTKRSESALPTVEK
jgi:hypothetical protein